MTETFYARLATTAFPAEKDPFFPFLSLRRDGLVVQMPRHWEKAQGGGGRAAAAAVAAAKSQDEAAQLNAFLAHMEVCAKLLLCVCLYLL